MDQNEMSRLMIFRRLEKIRMTCTRWSVVVLDRSWMCGDCDSWIPVFLSLHGATVRKFLGSVLYQWKSEKWKRIGGNQMWRSKLYSTGSPSFTSLDAMNTLPCLPTFQMPQTGLKNRWKQRPSMLWITLLLASYVGNTSLPKYECGMSLLAERRLACCDVTILSNNRGLLSEIQFPFEVMAELKCDAHRTTSRRICKNPHWNCCCIA